MSAPIRTAEKDVNYLSFNSASIVWKAGTDEEFDLGDVPIDTLANPLVLVPPDPKVYDSILKLSRRSNTVLTNVRAAQGKENCVDINNETVDCALHGEWGVEGTEGEQVFTIKGGSRNVTISGTIHSSGTDTDIEIGCWSDQSTKPVSNIDLSGLSRPNSLVLRVVFGRVNQPWKVLFLGKAPDDILLPPGAKIDRLGSAAEMAYWWAKRAWVAIRY